MSLKPFTYPFPETRFLHAGPSVYKFKIRYGNSIRGEEIEKKEVVSQELEDSIRVVLGNLENLQPFATEHFIVFPYKSKWERVSHLKFKHGDMALVPYPFVFTLYVELKWFHENLSPGKPINDSPPGLVLADRKAAGAMVRKWKCMEVPRSPSVSGLDSIKMGTSSQGPRKKKPLMETRRSRDRKTQQEWQETPAFDDTDVQEQARELSVDCSYHGHRDVSECVLQVVPWEETPAVIQSGGTALQGRSPHHCSRTTHLRLEDPQSREPVASSGF
ncbi:membrane-anchored junction protein isoform X3 [Talpa occidentalis]|uniref:membrane-anchored junction protein isoform X3 n=1 Tax=Talpa occidentalis TaxID=50954 RepID=UPI00188FB771|nr:membrane-anchored junction protein isoform X3 [Talpa occidentalis]